MQLVPKDKKQRLVVPYANIYEDKHSEETNIKIKEDLHIIKNEMKKICNIKEKKSIKKINNRNENIILLTYDYYVDNSNIQKEIIEKIIFNLRQEKKFNIIESIDTGLKNSIYSDCTEKSNTYFSKKKMIIMTTSEMMELIKPTQININNSTITSSIIGSNSGNNSNIVQPTIKTKEEEINDFVNYIRTNKPDGYIKDEFIKLKKVREDFIKYSNNKLKDKDTFTSSLLTKALGQKIFKGRQTYIKLNKL